MNYQTTQPAKTWPDRERIADLLSRYPRVSGNEVGEILAFMRTGPHLEIGLLTSNQRLKPNLDSFMADHKSHFRVKWSEGAAVIGGIAALLATLWFLWETLA